MGNMTFAVVCQLPVLTQYHLASPSPPSCAWSKDQAAALQALF